MTTFKPKIWRTLGVVAVIGAGTTACAYDNYGDPDGGWYGERGERGEGGERGERGEGGERDDDDD